MSDSDPPPSSATPSAPRPMPSFVAAGWALGATLVFQLLAQLTFSLRPAATVDLVSQVACQAAAYSLAIFLILRVHAPDADVGSFLAFRRTNVAFYALAILLGAALVVPAAALSDLITARFPPPPADDSIVELFQAVSLPRKLMMGAAACVVGPMLEELLFRGALFKPVRKSYRGLVTPTIVTTALLFALVHGEWQRMIHIGIIGLGLGLVRQRSGSIVPSMLVHVTFNAIPLVAAVMLTKPGGPPVDLPVPLWLAASCVAAALGLLGLIHLVGKRSSIALHAQELDQA
ncbi:MAG: CPBP family intramembrane glutamic endopeptidase [Byssovorax sp.]